MKKIYYLASGLFLASAANAQIQTIPVQRALPMAISNENHQEATQDRAAGDVIGTYQDNFSTPANWTLANTSSPAHDWTISSAGPGSAPELINSTSGGNFAWYDCDPQGDGSTVDATLTYATTFDLTGFP